MHDRKQLEEQILQAIQSHHYDPMNDVLFKFIFGKVERKDITMDFLNSVLEPSLGHEIKDIRFLSTEMIPQNANEKLTRLDVACELDTGEFVDVEVQVVNYHNMGRRTLYYWAGMYLMNLLKGENYRSLRPVITINIVAFKLLPQEDPHAMYGLYNIETKDRLNKDLEIHFLEIPKFINKPVQEMTKMERWMAYFSGKLDQREREELAMNEAEISNAYDATKVFFQTPQERMDYLNRQMAIMDYNYEERGMQKEQDRMSALIRLLKEQGRESELFEAAGKPEMLQKLYREFHLIE